MLDLRAELHIFGLVQGFQWLDGSFSEHVELTENRDPGDIDLVTFLYLPQNLTPSTQSYLTRFLLNRNRIKATHSVDHFPVQLNYTTPELIVEETVYWYSLFSHRKADGFWKGCVQLDLDPGGDLAARAFLDNMDKLGGST